MKVKHQIRISSGPISVCAELFDTDIAESIWETLPFRVPAHVWGQEIYFDIPVYKNLACGQEVVTPGNLGYWPAGPAFCIFFGPTPLSRCGEIRAAGSVEVFGKLLDNPQIFAPVREGEEIIIDRL